MSDNQYPTPAETAAHWGQQTQEVPAPDGYASPGPAPWAGQFQQAVPHKKRTVPAWAWFLIVVGVMAVACSVGTLALAGGDTTKEKALPVAATEPARKPGAVVGSAGAQAAGKVVTKPAAPVYKLGVPIRGGDFTFTLNSKRCGISQVGSRFLNKKPQGSYCRLDLTVKNVTSKPHVFVAEGSVSVTDTKGREFSVDSEAGAYGNKNAMTFIDEINPGNQVRGYVFFDVSGGVKLASVTFEAGLFTLAQDVVVPLS